MSHLEEALAWQLKASSLPFVREFHAIKGRKFRFDFAVPAYNLLVEVQGGTYSQGKMGHSSGSGIHRDCEKYSLAAVDGWRVILCDCKQIASGDAIRWIQLACCEGGRA